MSQCHKKYKNELWLLIDSLAFGGIETHVVELAYGLKTFEQNVRVLMLTKYENESAIIDKLKQREIAFNYLEDLFLVSLENKRPQKSKLLGKLFRVIQYFEPRVIHAHGYKASILGKIAKLRFGHHLKQISTYHAGEKPKGKVKWYDRLDRYSAFISDTSLSVSDAIAKKIPIKTHVINNFISLPKLIDTSEVKKHIAFVGRLSHEKAPDRFVKLASDFRSQEFHLYGDGEMLKELRFWATSNVIFHGFKSDMTYYWDNIELLLITSRYEGLPMTALEAMARCIPVVALNVGAIDTLIEHNRNGWIAQNVDELTDYINAWFSLSKPEKEQIKYNARKRVQESFSTDAMIPKLLKFYY